MSGLVAGLLGVTGWGGFLYFVAAQALVSKGSAPCCIVTRHQPGIQPPQAAVVLSFKAGHTPKAFCSGWYVCG